MAQQQKQNLKKPVDWDELYPGRFVKAGELLGKKVTLTIASVDLDELEGDNGKKVKGVISFRETPKQLALNRTNGICLREMFGRQIPQWEGKKIVLFPDEWNGEPCIRIWGSPDIDRDATIEVALPRRRPIKMTMHSTRGQQSGRGQQPQQRQAPPVTTDGEPPADHEWEPGRE